MNSKIKILLVEDESIVAIDLKKILQNLNYEVIDVIRTGEKAISTAIEKEPDLILMDIMLEGEITGIEAATEISKKKDIPVIYITAYADEGTISRVKTTQPAGYILKPFDEKNLLSTIEMALYKHKLDKKLKESEERYRKLVENSPVAIGIVSGRRIVYANPYAVKLFGAHNEADLKNKYLFDFIHSDYSGSLKGAMQKIIKGGETIEISNVKLLTLDGRVIEVEFASIPTHYMGNAAIQILIRDVTEMKRREKIQHATLRILHAANSTTTLNELYSKFHQILKDYIPVINILIAFYDHPGGNLDYDYYVDELKTPVNKSKSGKGLTEYVIYAGGVQLLNQKKIEELIDSGKVEYDCPTLKSLLGIPIHLYDIKPGAVIKGAIVLREYKRENLFGEEEKEFMKNIVFPLSRAIEKKHIEERNRRYTEELKRMNDTKDKFLSLVSHDLKSPFNSLMGYTEILKNEYMELSAEERDVFISSIYESTRFVYNLLNDLLEFSKFYLGLIDIVPKKINIKELIDQNLSALSTMARQKNIKLENQITKDYVVLAEEEMIGSVIRNLLTNAIKFTNENGTIRITSEVDKRKLKVLVSDNGIGMDEETKANLFEIILKKSHPGTSNEEGTGLGLILTKEFIEKNDGEISVNSEVGKGTTVTFSLPLADEKF